MTPFITNTKSKTRTLIAKQTDVPGMFHIAISMNSTWNEMNEEIVKAAITRINWHTIDVKN